MDRVLPPHQTWWLENGDRFGLQQWQRVSKVLSLLLNNPGVPCALVNLPMVGVGFGRQALTQFSSKQAIVRLSVHFPC